MLRGPRSSMQLVGAGSIHARADSPYLESRTFATMPGDHEHGRRLRPGPILRSCCRSTSACPRTCPGKAGLCSPASSSTPVTGPRRVRRLNIDGDGQGDLGGHGGEQRAVFVYQIESYRYWERELGRDDFVHGQFGENFTIEGLRRRQRVHRRPLPDRHRRLRGHAAACHLLPRRHPHERPAHARAARLAPPPRLLLPGARRRRGAGRRRDRQARVRARSR